MPRLVVVLFGPPGAGKTTIAHDSGLTIYDRDDPEWKPYGEAHFRRGIARIADDQHAAAVVIRSGATSNARRRTIGEITATHAYLILTDPAVCHYRVGHRRRSDRQTSQAAIDGWYAKYDHDDRLPQWPGDWAIVRTTPNMTFASRRSSRPERSKAGDPRSTREWRALREQVYAEESHCWRCGLWVDQGLASSDPMSRTVDHLDPIGRGGAGVPDRSRVRLAHRRCNGRRGHRVDPYSVSRSLSVSIALI